MGPVQTANFSIMWWFSIQSGDVRTVACFRHACRLLGISMLRQHELAVMLKGSILLPPSPNQLPLCLPVSCSMQRARGNNWLGLKLTEKMMENSSNPEQLLSLIHSKGSGLFVQHRGSVEQDQPQFQWQCWCLVTQSVCHSSQCQQKACSTFFSIPCDSTEIFQRGIE